MMQEPKKKEKKTKCADGCASVWFRNSSIVKPGPALSVGQLVRSIAGRDKGQLYLVLQIERNLLLLVDGRKRNMENPKRKNRQHVQAVGKVAADFANQLKAGRPPSDGQVRAALLGLEQQNPQS